MSTITPFPGPLGSKNTSQEDFERDVVATGIRKILQLELSVRAEGSAGSLRGCGMLVVNPPYRFDGEAETIVAWLAQALATDGGYRTRWLVPE